MNKRTIVAVMTILVIYIFLTSFVVIIIENIPNPILNPPPSPNLIPIGISYPDRPGITIPGTDLFVSFILTFNGSIAENTPIQVTNAYCQILSKKVANVWTVQVGFQQALPWAFKESFEEGGTYISGLSGVSFTRHFQDINDTVLWPSMDVFYFPVAGDFSPAISITYDNGTEVLYTYDQIKVHVLSASEVEVMNINRLNLGLSYVLLFFTYVEGIVIIRELFKTQEPEVTAIETRPKGKEKAPRKVKKTKKLPGDKAPEQPS